MDITNYIMQQRDSTKWIPYLLTNISYDITSTGFALGGYIDLPRRYLLDRSLICLNKSQSGNTLYTDSLCLFRSLTYHKFGWECYKKPLLFNKYVDCYFDIYKRYCQKKMIPIENKIFSFQGVALEDLCYFENCFEININIFNKAADGMCSTLRSSLCKHKDTMNLQEYCAHLSYIKNLNNYAKKYECDRCEKIFKKRTGYQRHLAACPKTVKHSFPGGYFKLPKNVYQLLEELDVYVPKKDRFYPFFASFDLEAMMKHVAYRQGSKLKWVSQHIPFCMGVCSNIPGFLEGYVYINDDMDKLVQEMILVLNKMSAKAKQLCEEKWTSVFKALDEKEKEWNQIINQFGQNGSEEEEEEEEEEEDLSAPDQPGSLDQSEGYVKNYLETCSPDVGLYNPLTYCVEYKPNPISDFSIFNQTRKKSIVKSCKNAVENIQNMRTKFTQHISKLPILGFCSSNYDTVLISKKSPRLHIRFLSSHITQVLDYTLDF